MANYKKIAAGIVSVVMASSMALSLAACDKPDKPTTDEYNHWEVSTSVYNDTLGEFYQYYSNAKGTDKSLAERYALMAQAEAKLYESGVLLPTQANGGNYAVSKVANGTVNSTLWGNDSDRLHYAIVATTPIKISDRQAMKEYRNDPANATQSGADYLAWMRTYLSEHGYTTKATYNRAYTTDPITWDVLSTSEQSDTEPIVQTYDGLIEYDVKNQMQPAMSTNIPDPVDVEGTVYNPYTDEDEATVTFTFNIRKGQQWVDSQGRKVADFKASDFATGFQHMLDSEGGLEYLVDGVVVGADEYMEGTVGFDGVKVTADDSAMTVTYQVYQSAESYFLTMLSYSVFAPLSKSYYESKGGKFGDEFDPAAESYTYGKDKDSIAYCGPYIITEHTAKSKITFSKNDSWWNKDTANARNTDTINWLFNSGEDATKSYTDFKAGTIDGCGLVGANVESAKKDKLSDDSDNIFDTYAYTSAMDATAFCAFVNVNRRSFANYNDSSKGISLQSDAEKERTNKAVNNVNFRRALLTALDREAYMAQVVGADLAETSLSNMYTPGTFVSLPAEVTIKMGGVNKTYPAGTMYGQIVQDQLDADGVQITVWKKVNGEYTYTGFNGWYNPEYAKSELAKAVTALAAAGVTVDAQHPIEIDYPYMSSNTYYNARANVVKQGLETVLEGKVKINLIDVDAEGWQRAGYWTRDGQDSNYDIYDLSGWGPDYGDPQTYLDTMLPDGNGYMTKCLGIF